MESENLLSKIQSGDMLSLFDLWRLVFKFTFEKAMCPHTTKKTIEQNILKWNGFIQMQKSIKLQKYGLDPETQYTPVGQKGDALDECEFQLGNICSWAVKEEKGELQHLVDTYAKHNIDWRLAKPMCHVFPEYAKNRNFRKGQAALLKNIKDNPEIYLPKKPIMRFET